MIPCTCGREADDCIDCLNDYISDNLVIEGIRFNVDEGIIERFAESLINQDSKLLEETISLARLRLKGICFCSAYDKSECICGAWG